MTAVGSLRQSNILLYLVFSEYCVVARLSRDQSLVRPRSGHGELLPELATAPRVPWMSDIHDHALSDLAIGRHFHIFFGTLLKFHVDILSSLGTLLCIHISIFAMHKHFQVTSIRYL